MAPVESGIVQLEQVAFRYLRRTLWVLRDVTLTVPQIEWMRAASHGPSELARVFPLLALRTVAWTAVTGALYAGLRRTRP